MTDLAREMRGFFWQGFSMVSRMQRLLTLSPTASDMDGGFWEEEQDSSQDVVARAENIRVAHAPLAPLIQDAYILFQCSLLDKQGQVAWEWIVTTLPCNASTTSVPVAFWLLERGGLQRLFCMTPIIEPLMGGPPTAFGWQVKQELTSDSSTLLVIGASELVSVNTCGISISLGPRVLATTTTTDPVRFATISLPNEEVIVLQVGAISLGCGCGERQQPPRLRSEESSCGDNSSGVSVSEEDYVTIAQSMVSLLLMCVE